MLTLIIFAVLFVTGLVMLVRGSFAVTAKTRIEGKAAQMTGVVLIGLPMAAWLLGLATYLLLRGWGTLEERAAMWGNVTGVSLLVVTAVALVMLLPRLAVKTAT